MSKDNMLKKLQGVITNKKGQRREKEDDENDGKGGRNLCLLGIFAALIAIISTSISLKIYHDTGDVYLDRSRPGYISEDEKKNNGEEQEKLEAFSDSGPIDDAVIDEYLGQLDQLIDGIEETEDFSSIVLSDESLGITPTTDGQEKPLEGEFPEDIDTSVE